MTIALKASKSFSDYPPLTHAGITATYFLISSSKALLQPSVSYGYLLALHSSSVTPQVALISKLSLINF